MDDITSSEWDDVMEAIKDADESLPAQCPSCKEPVTQWTHNPTGQALTCTVRLTLPENQTPDSL